MESVSARIDEKIKELGDWRGKTLAKVRGIIHEADPEVVEEWKWVKATNPGTPVFSHGGIICAGETYKNAVKLTFAKGAALKDPTGHQGPTPTIPGSASWDALSESDQKKFTPNSQRSIGPKV